MKTIGVIGSGDTRRNPIYGLLGTHIRLINKRLILVSPMIDGEFSLGIFHAPPSLVMPRLPRIIIPNIPHHITQRGNRRQQTFFSKQDYETYLTLLAQACLIYKVKILSYCLMPNHVHLILIPKCGKSLTEAISQAHRDYTRYINFKNNWRGHLWQGRYASFPMDEKHLLLAARYIELNPVKAKMVKDPAHYPWSSARAYLGLEPSSFLDTRALLERVSDWSQFLQNDVDDQTIKIIESHQRTGRPLGSVRFLKELEKLTDLELLPKKPGPKRAITPV